MNKKRKNCMGEIDDLIPKASPRYSENGKAKPIWENKLVFDTNLDTLENIYYWIIDFMEGYYSGDVEKVTDTFTASPGSAYFGNLSATAQRMQEEGMKILGTLNAIIKNIINIIYELKNLDIRLKQYDKLNNPKTRREGLLSLKELWLTSVDMLRQSGSINYMAQNYGFTTLRPAFFAAGSVKEVDKMDLNENVKRLLISRLTEFFDWIKLSGEELRKRYEIEKSQLRSQIDTVKLYSSWVRPYLQSAEQLRMKESKEASLVSIFAQMILELHLFAKKKVNVENAVIAKELPSSFKDDKDVRSFYEILTVDLKFRTYPTQQFPHAGKVEITLRAYTLNEDELLLLERLREEDALESTLNVARNLTESSLKQIEKDVDYFLKPKEEENPEPKDEYLFYDLYKAVKNVFIGKSKAEKDKEEKEEKERQRKEKEEKIAKFMKEGVPEDNYKESLVRFLAESSSSKSCFTLFDVFKKSHGFASFPNPFEEPDSYKRIRMKIAEVNASKTK